MAIWAAGDAIHVANTGAPLTQSGVHSLLALRVSAKDPDDHGAVVGRFGVGFTATAALARSVEIRSQTGTICFDAARTADAITQEGIGVAGQVPLLRLAWPGALAPRDGFATEIVLGLTDAHDANALLAVAAGQAPDLLTALTALTRITIADSVFGIERTELRSDAGGAWARRLEVSVDDQIAEVFTEVERSPSRWLVRSEAGAVIPGGRDVLWAPTPTDIELSLPCRLIARLRLTHDRRHVHPDADIASAAVGYLDLLRRLGPVDAVSLVPAAYRARGGDDARLIDAVLGELRSAPWLTGVASDVLVPAQSVVLIGLSPELGEVLGEVFADLVHPDLSLAHLLPTLESLGVSRIGLAEVARRLSGVERPTSWWGRLYAALAPLVATAVDAEELATLPIPRSDGRMNVGARGLFTTHSVRTPLRWIRTVDPDVDGPLLERLGAARLSIPDALADPVLRTLVDEAVELAEDGADADSDSAELADEVLTLVVADPQAPVPDWLSRLPLPTDDGELRSADELLLGGSPLERVLVDDHPFGLVARDIAERFGAEALRRLGVGWGFSMVCDELPTAPDHELPDEEQWWDSLPDAPEKLCAVRDLDLVDPQRWPQALTLLVEDESTAAVLADRRGYTAWWLRQFAEVDELLLGEYRAPSDVSLDGVLDPLVHPHADALAPALAALPPDSAADAALLCARLGDQAREVSPGVARGVYAAVVRACRAGTFDWADIDEPGGVRVVSGIVADANSVPVILDEPWWAQAIEPDVLVVGPDDAEGAALLADILDLPVASDEFTGQPLSDGVVVPSTVTEAVLFAAETGRDLAGEIRIHDELRIVLSRNNGSDERTVAVRWWVDASGVTHLSRRM